MKNIKYITSLIALAAFIFISSTYFIRFDLTSDKRYSISNQSQQLMRSIKEPINIIIYLDGELNPGFLRLKNSTEELIHELSVYAKNTIVVQFVNPSIAESSAEREAKYAQLITKGLTPTNIYERDKEGKSIQKTVFPWIEIQYKTKTTAVCLLKNNRKFSGEQNLNTSIENLEYEITDGIRQLTTSEVSKIAFIEGHGELNEAETYDISKSFSRYFQVDRGIIANDATVLDNYKAIIIAKPTKPFTETDKYIIDQYIMRGGRVLWLLDGVRIAKEDLSKKGLSPAMELDVNLSDQLFRYGVRINPVLVQDVQCVSIPLNIAPAGKSPQFEATPWHYAPLLLTSPQHAISKNINEVKAEFCSAIEPVGDNKRVNAQVLLASSDHSHIIPTPSTIDLSITPKDSDNSYFNARFVPIALIIEGNFESNFTNRLPPNELANARPFIGLSAMTRQVFVADGDIIRNETNGIASDSSTIPLGYDRYTSQQFGNKEFILNTILYLTDNDEWMQLRNRTVKLRLLNKHIIESERMKWQLLNITIPLLLLFIIGIFFQLSRKRKYTR